MSEEKMQAEQEHCHCEGKCSHEGHSHAHGDHQHGDHHHTEVIHTGHEFDHIDKKTEQRIYILEGLGCANCAAKMERQICASGGGDGGSYLCYQTA